MGRREWKGGSGWALRSHGLSRPERRRHILLGVADGISYRVAQDIVAPKKAKSGYLLFADEVRPKVTMENPDKKMTELSAIIGDKWKNLPEADKLKFTQVPPRIP